MNRNTVCCTLGAWVLGAAPLALAHHSYGMFDLHSEKILTGTVTEFQWTNPHTWVELDVLEPSGGMTHWSLENGSVTGLVHQGWKRSTLKVGDKISVVFHPLRSGEHGGSVMGVITADGKSLGEPLTAPDTK